MKVTGAEALYLFEGTYCCHIQSVVCTLAPVLKLKIWHPWGVDRNLIVFLGPQRPSDWTRRSHVLGFLSIILSRVVCHFIESIGSYVAGASANDIPRCEYSLRDQLILGPLGAQTSSRFSVFH